MTGPARPFEAAITGLGLVTPAGIGVKENWDRLLSGVSCAATDEELRGSPVDFSCRVPGFDPAALLGGFSAWQLDRFVQLAIASSRQAVEEAGWDPATWDGARVGVVLGNSLGGMQSLEQQHGNLLEKGPRNVSPLLIPRFMVNMAAAQVAIDLGARGPSLVTATACASGATAVGTARELLRSGACDVVLAGGTESALTPLVMAGLGRMGALSGRGREPERASRPFDTDRDGFVAAEGAGVLVLERMADARARGARVRAVVRGYGSSTDAYHATAPDPQGQGIERALRAALADAQLGAADVDHVNAHGTGTPLNDVTEGRALQRVLGARPLVTSAKGVIGHTLGAAGAIEAAYTALAIEHNSVPPTANLTRLDPELELDVVSGSPRSALVDVAVSTSLGFGGHNAALVLTTA
ncbi:beta-ketoacyl-[acyl-carrier-protein] synthase family protein [Streptomyces sp. NBC_00576]|uniref:beta-ketoacyl-[acyl-carrier-protein] synthase family protein n=1 Tax=Streptomyces sp. NBC_00576 TaxID=2903665 RepID=UPI002E806B27|nr:beta-ketoacyl-[acyl-carrier-protein] synthase family protein [Streptomyces sp. NBC_00576]WUB72088.1 beta-ketoacyl-[acyl-carrier-protein] synthase family protein [Streptomyces sp. NBC_00576]